MDEGGPPNNEAVQSDASERLLRFAFYPSPHDGGKPVAGSARAADKVECDLPAILVEYLGYRHRVVTGDHTVAVRLGLG